MKVIVCKNEGEVAEEAFRIMQETMQNPKAVLGLATGSSPVKLYEKMIEDYRQNGTSYKEVTTFNLDEYVGLPRNHEQSYYTFMHENLFNEIDVKEENIHIPNGEAANPEEEAKSYEEALKKVTVDLQVLGIGSDGHIAFNEPGTPLDAETHIAELTRQTIQDNARFFENDMTKVPATAITQGLASIMRAKKIVLIATGANKADAVYGMIKGKVTVDCPASILQNHENVTVVLDTAAASRLS